MADLTTLANVKGWLGITDTNTARDALLTRLITAASQFIETWLNRTVSGGVLTYNAVRDGGGGVTFVPANTPLVSITSLRIDGETIPASTGVNVPGYVFNTHKVSLRGGYKFTRGVANVELDYTAGYTAVPGEVEQVCIEVVGARFKARDRIGISSKGLAGETISFIQNDLTRDMKATLMNYKKVVLL